MVEKKKLCWPTNATNKRGTKSVWGKSLGGGGGELDTEEKNSGGSVGLRLRVGKSGFGTARWDLDARDFSTANSTQIPSVNIQGAQLWGTEQPNL